MEDTVNIGHKKEMMDKDIMKDGEDSIKVNKIHTRK